MIFQGELTNLNFSIKFPRLSKLIDLMKDLKYEHKSIFPLCQKKFCKKKFIGKKIIRNFFYQKVVGVMSMT